MTKKELHQIVDSLEPCAKRVARDYGIIRKWVEKKKKVQIIFGRSYQKKALSL